MNASEDGRIRPLSTVEGFLCGGFAACIAVTFSNPFELAKTRMQLQGELSKGGTTKEYRSALDVLRKTSKSEGIRGLQRGLGPAYVFQVLLNGSRLGLYEPFRRGMNDFISVSPNDHIPMTSLFAGAASGIIGASLGNPLFLIKARMQASSATLPGESQYYYKNSLSALATIFRAEKARGLIRGIDAAILRTALGSSVQMPSYNWTKDQIVSCGWFPVDSPWTYLISSTLSGICVCVAMQPADTALTRMYNQPTIRLEDGRVHGVLYKNPIDCLWKTFKTEGFAGLYKGSTAHLMRIAPHTIITLTANDLIINFYRKYRI